MSDQPKSLNPRASASAEAPDDHIRTLWGVADILGELSSARWQDNTPLHFGLEALAKAV